MEFPIEFVTTKDGSNTLYSKEYSQHYHNCNDGALNESLSKHIIPALNHHKMEKQINILDICFGLGYNTLATLYYIKKYNFDIKVNIYSPELDAELLNSLIEFEYPVEFNSFKNIIKMIAKNGFYTDQKCSITVFNGDAREYLKQLQKDALEFDIVYQDPFSSEVNKNLWTVEYFTDIYKVLKDNGIITTYAIATPVRLSLYESGFNIYEIQNGTKRKSTIALKKKNINYKFIDMELKKQRNQKAKSLKD